MYITEGCLTDLNPEHLIEREQDDISLSGTITNPIISWFHISWLNIVIIPSLLHKYWKTRIIIDQQVHSYVLAEQHHKKLSKMLLIYNFIFTCASMLSATRFSVWKLYRFLWKYKFTCDKMWHSQLSLHDM